MASAVQKTTALLSFRCSRFFVEASFRQLQVLDAFRKWHFVSVRPFSTSTAQYERLCWEGCSHGALLRKLEVSLKDHQVDEAWVAFNDFKNLYGFPKDSVVSRLLTELSYSSDPCWLQKAFDLVSQILKEKSNLLSTEILTKLSLSFARAQMPIPASVMLRVILERENLPTVSVLRSIVLHMLKTEIGTCLTSNLLIQICECFLIADKNDYAKSTKPDTLIFNLVLDACVRFKSSLRGQELVEWMSRTGIMADAHSIIIITQIYEMNGLRDEIKKFKDHIDRVSAPFVRHYQQFYECLLNLHFKYNDLDSAADLVLGMNRFRGFIPRNKEPRNGLQRSFFVSIGSQNLRAGLKIQIFPEMLQKDSIIKVEHDKELLSFKNGKFLLSNRALAKFIHGYKRQGRISELTKVILSLQKDFPTVEGSSLCYDVIDACIRLGWLETAHDILDDMETAEFPCGLTAYMLLLMAYHRREMLKEVEALLRQIGKAGHVTNLSGEMIASTCLPEKDDNASSCSKPDLADFIVQEMGEEDKVISPIVFKLNSSIYFFCKAKMMGDALKLYRRMQVMGVRPTVQTFAYLVYGYSSLERYRDITILWGEIKRNMKTMKLFVSRDLYESFLINFLRGGYFERVMEVAGYMNEHKMCIDKWMYKTEFLKLHKNLYKGLEASEGRNEVQRKRLEFVQTFRKWVGID